MAEFAIFAVPWATSLLLSLAVEAMARPGVTPFWRRPWPTLALHGALWSLVDALWLAILQRPWFAVAAELALLVLIVAVNNAKVHTLREPFVFQDFEYFTDALRHPRLYFPFLGFWRALAAASAMLAAIVAGLTLEAPLPWRWPHLPLALASLLVMAGLLVLLAMRRCPTPVWQPATDLTRLGLLASLWQYGVAEARPVAPPDPSPLACFQPPADRPHLVVVQSESFWDARRCCRGLRPQLLDHFDQLKAQALCHGPLTVPCWGANTVRSEFALLSGLAGEALGVHQFNPYRKLAGSGIPTLASLLKSQGYRTLCIHPYPASFYNRHKIYPGLGFDTFIDIQAFGEEDRSGPYIGDVALTDRICSLLAGLQGQPVFLFVITMENHGPLHLEQVQQEDLSRFYTTPPPPGCDDLTIYARHLANADQALAKLHACLQALPGHWTLCFYGDHLPIMPEVYAALGEPDGTTDYVIWQKGKPANTQPAPATVETLACRILEAMGWQRRKS